MNRLVNYGDSDSEEDDVVGPPVPPQFRAGKSRSGTEDRGIEEDDVFGPPVPPRFQAGKSGSATEAKETDEQDVPGPPVPSQFQAAKSGSETEDEESDEDDVVGPPVPSKFQVGDSEKVTEDEEEDDEEVGPPVPKDLETGTVKDGSMSYDVDKMRISKDSDEESDEKEEEADLPVSSHVLLRHGCKAVSGLAVDPAGARLATGSVDYDVRFWDFAGMDSSLQAFRMLTPCGNYPVKHLSYSCTGDAVLVVSGSSQAKVLDRDGHEIMECVKGDQYVSDTARTKGHVAQLTSGSFHPRRKEEFVTAAEDGTVRLWDTKHSGKQHWKIIKCRSQNGLRTAPSAVTYSRDGNLTAVACTDGSLQIWDNRKMYVHPASLVRNAHENNTETSCTTFSYSGTQLATRGGDDTLKLWDTRNIKTCLFSKGNLFSRYTSTDCCFGPDDTVLVTGVSLLKGETQGKVHFVDVKSFETIRELAVGGSHVIKTYWHPRLRQLFVGSGDGSIKIFYNEDNSGRGAKLCASKTQKKKKHVEVVVGQQIITPHALPMFRQDKPKSTKKRLEKDRLDPVKSRRPDLPIKAGQGGRLAASGSTLSSFVIRNLGLSKRVEDDQDPREAILRFAKEAAENPYWISPAYAQTQPKPIFQSNQDNQDPEQPPSKKTKL